MFFFQGLPESVICTTINKVCASGLKSITLAAQSIQLGISDLIVAGGMESMSNVPFYLSKVREGWSLGSQIVHDGLLTDGLIDPKYQCHMGVCGEETAVKYQISRKDQDDFACQSYERAKHAHEVKLN